MPLTLINPRALQPVTLAEAKLHLRVDTSADDALITALIIAATDDAEHLMDRAVLPQSWQLTLDKFESAEITLQKPPITAITSVKYLQASDGVLTTLNPATYVLAPANDYTARLVPAYATSWPATRGMPEAVRVLFVTGYADAASVPEPIKAWIKLRIGALYANREAWTVGVREALNRNEFVDRLLDRYTALAF
jgi:uncharacterized phiE125 gp8 family phage protein